MAEVDNKKVFHNTLHRVDSERFKNLQKEMLKLGEEEFYNEHYSGHSELGSELMSLGYDQDSPYVRAELEKWNNENPIDPDEKEKFIKTWGDWRTKGGNTIPVFVDYNDDQANRWTDYIMMELEQYFIDNPTHAKLVFGELDKIQENVETAKDMMILPGVKNLVMDTTNKYGYIIQAINGKNNYEKVEVFDWVEDCADAEKIAHAIFEQNPDSIVQFQKVKYYNFTKQFLIDMNKTPVEIKKQHDRLADAEAARYRDKISKIEKEIDFKTVFEINGKPKIISFTDPITKKEASIRYRNETNSWTVNFPPKVEVDFDYNGYYIGYGSLDEAKEKIQQYADQNIILEDLEVRVEYGKSIVDIYGADNEITVYNYRNELLASEQIDDIGTIWKLKNGDKSALSAEGSFIMDNITIKHIHGEKINDRQLNHIEHVLNPKFNPFSDPELFGATDSAVTGVFTEPVAYTDKYNNIAENGERFSR